jgi:hypothetical protein
MKKWSQDGNLLERCRDASCPHINQTRKAITRQRTRDINLLEEGEMLAIHPSIKPENKSFNKEKGKNGHGMETS